MQNEHASNRATASGQSDLCLFLFVGWTGQDRTIHFLKVLYIWNASIHSEQAHLSFTIRWNKIWAISWDYGTFLSSVNSFFKCAMGLDVWFLVGPFIHFHALCVRTAKALVRLHECAGSPEPSLIACVISTVISHELAHFKMLLYTLGKSSNRLPSYVKF